jgi:hypothetical protein
VNAVRNFADITGTALLKKFLESKSGTLYFDTTGPVLAMIVRHFDRDLPPALVKPFAELTSAARSWIEQHPDVARWVAIEPVIESGADFTARRHHVYYQSLRSYDEPDEDDPIEPPDELAPMRAAVRAALGHPEDERAQIVEAVIARSLLGATGKTYLGRDRFIVVELTPTRVELERFAAAS